MVKLDEIITELLLRNLLTSQYETELIKQIIRKSYRCGHGSTDMAMVVSNEDYLKIRKWIGEVNE